MPVQESGEAGVTTEAGSAALRLSSGCTSIAINLRARVETEGNSQAMSGRRYAGRYGRQSPIATVDRRAFTRALRRT